FYFTIDNSPSIAVTSPNGGEKIYAGRGYSINWTASNLPTNYVKIEYSLNNGGTWETLTASYYNYGYYTWDIPDGMASTECLIRISAVANSNIFDVSNSLFTIAPQQITVIAPNGGETVAGCSTTTISWAHEGVQDYVNLYYSANGGAS